MAVLPLAAPSRSPNPKILSWWTQREAKANEFGDTLEVVQLACEEEAKSKGTSSLLGIFSRLRKGSADQDYVACMKGHGYEVKP